MHSKLAVLLIVLSTTLTHAGLRFGVASTDVTPDYPVRLNGYASRKTLSEGVDLPLFVKALALEQQPGKTALMLTIDNCGISREIGNDIVSRIEKKHSIPAERIVIFSSHTHSAPGLTDAIPNMFGAPLPADEQAVVDRYTRELIENILSTAATAISKLEDGSVFFTQGKASFAKNRRTPGGPVDHAVPLLVIKDSRGAIKSLVANYACHCTTLQGDLNRIHGDWAGLAASNIQAENPGVTALISIGCGADSNPAPRGTLANVNAHGEELAKEVQRLIEAPLKPISGNLEFRAKAIDLPFDPLPSREEWTKRAAEPGIVGYHAKRNLERLDRGEKLPTALPYLVQTWNFGTDLAFVFLPGEVVVDYSLRLKSLYDPNRLWVSGYANWVPCYIPSERILREGGYEAESSLWYYDRPARLSPTTEELIISTVQELLPKSFLIEKKSASLPPPRDPHAALAAIRTDPPLVVELAAAEPLIADPVAVDWGADGKLWVVEMRDFPQGMDGNWKPGGRVKILEDVDGNGSYDRATLFLDDLPFPTGITCWNGGAFICAAPDILFAADTNGDGKADEVRKLFSGFATDNYQARVNSLSLGLDGWFYGANGLIGGTITGGKLKEPLNISNRDFRFKPATGEFEAASGLTQQGRVRDDFGHWFGCDNSTLLWHYPLPEHELRRNPHVSPPATRAAIAAGPDPNQLFPISTTLERFNDPGHANRVTSACGLGIYRDAALGPEFYGNAFVCEPVHNLIRRMKLEPNGSIFKATKAGTPGREFLSSEDSWFRPVQVRTGPDGALWVVDMYRLVVEHPRWITPERLKTLEIRAGDDKGRIYRVRPSTEKRQPIADLTKLETRALASALQNGNGTERDRIHLELIRRRDNSAVPILAGLANSTPAVAVQAMAVLRELNALRPETIRHALQSENPELRRFALELSGSSAAPLEDFVADPSGAVRLQAALTPGARHSPKTTRALADLLAASPSDRWLRTAVLSSANGRAADLALEVLRRSLKEPELLNPLVDTALANGGSEARKIRKLIMEHADSTEIWNLNAVERLARLMPGNDLEPVIGRAAKLALNPETPVSARVAAVHLLRHSKNGDVNSGLLSLVRSIPDPRLLRASIETLLARGGLNAVLSEWPRHSPLVRHTVIAAALERVDLIPALLRALEKFRSAGELSLAQKQALRNHRDGDIRSAAARLFESPTDRAGLLVAYEFLPAGNLARGAELFATHCASCHAMNGRGTALGPNLAGLTDRSTPFLLAAILDPNRAVENRYLGYSVELADGRELTGIIADENSSSLTIIAAGGVKEQVLRSQISAVRASNLSLMPEGFEQALPPAEMAHLIAYLQSTALAQAP